MDHARRYRPVADERLTGAMGLDPQRPWCPWNHKALCHVRTWTPLPQAADARGPRRRPSDRPGRSGGAAACPRFPGMPSVEETGRPITRAGPVPYDRLAPSDWSTQTGEPKVRAAPVPYDRPVASDRPGRTGGPMGRAGPASYRSGRGIRSAQALAGLWHAMESSLTSVSRHPIGPGSGGRLPRAGPVSYGRAAARDRPGRRRAMSSDGSRPRRSAGRMRSAQKSAGAGGMR
jgi:hypothetical protein